MPTIIGCQSIGCTGEKVEAIIHSHIPNKKNYKTYTSIQKAAKDDLKNDTNPYDY